MTARPQTVEARFARAMVELAAPWPGAVAVSGGGDSLALMVLLAGWAKAHKHPTPAVLSVDHGLRPESRKEAERVKKLAGGLGLRTEILPWKGPKPSSDVEAEARLARYSLMGRWCADHKIPALYVAHTVEDQAETFLLRLARGSGLDGLSGMQPVSALPVPEFQQIRLVRPLLQFRRAELRDFLRIGKIEWAEDAMNSDPRFARARLRAAWPKLEELGLMPERVADAAVHLGRARAALEEMTERFLQRGARFQDDRAAIDPLRLKMLPREVGLRALAFILGHVSGQEYRPRFDSLERLFDSILSGNLGRGATLHGCIVAPAPADNQVFGSATITISPELTRKVKEPAAPSRRTI
ncbi:MAG: tRNA lysidine(34) synthetase TilS [Rhizomicrobium sp.]